MAAIVLILYQNDINELKINYLIPDYRKITVDLLLVPFFIVIKKLTANQTFDLTNEYFNRYIELYL
jgi:hypothetical protein